MSNTTTNPREKAQNMMKNQTKYPEEFERIFKLCKIMESKTLSFENLMKTEELKNASMKEVVMVARMMIVVKVLDGRPEPYSRGKMFEIMNSFEFKTKFNKECVLLLGDMPFPLRLFCLHDMMM
tara:strand:+ start:157 stop:528 length:372 start_codon:yes stop_codon:yes gene_type:complete